MPQQYIQDTSSKMNVDNLIYSIADRFAKRREKIHKMKAGMESIGMDVSVDSYGNALYDKGDDKYKDIMEQDLSQSHVSKVDITQDPNAQKDFREYVSTIAGLPLSEVATAAIKKGASLLNQGLGNKTKDERMTEIREDLIQTYKEDNNGTDPTPEKLKEIETIANANVQAEAKSGTRFGASSGKKVSVKDSENYQVDVNETVAANGFEPGYTIEQQQRKALLDIAPYRYTSLLRSADAYDLENPDAVAGKNPFRAMAELKADFVKTNQGEIIGEDKTKESKTTVPTKFGDVTANRDYSVRQGVTSATTIANDTRLNVGGGDKSVIDTMVTIANKDSKITLPVGSGSSQSIAAYLMKKTAGTNDYDPGALSFVNKGTGKILFGKGDEFAKLRGGINEFQFKIGTGKSAKEYSFKGVMTKDTQNKIAKAKNVGEIEKILKDGKYLSNYADNVITVLATAIKSNGWSGIDITNVNMSTNHAGASFEYNHSGDILSIPTESKGEIANWFNAFGTNVKDISYGNIKQQ